MAAEAGNPAKCVECVISATHLRITVVGDDEGTEENRRTAAERKMYASRPREGGYLHSQGGGSREKS